MHIFYYRRRDAQPNFGDDLNPWLWPQLLPDVFDGDRATQFVGTGTLLNHRLLERTAQAKRVIIFSSGVGYERPLGAIPAHWHIVCVRGPLSAKRLGLPPQRAITDGGILVRRCFTPAGPRSNTYAFMPHVHHASFAEASWKRLCARLGIGYIDPRWPIEQVLSAIATTQVLLAEAMHGAIVADALRTPWIPVVTSPRILSFKWQDWCASIDVPYRPWRLLPLPDYPPYARGVRSSLRAGALWANRMRQTVVYRPTQLFTESVEDSLCSLLHRGQPHLSQDAILERLTDQLEEALGRLKPWIS